MDMDSCDSFRRALLWYRFKRNATRIWPIICIAAVGFAAYQASSFSHSREGFAESKSTAQPVNYEQVGPYRIAAGS